VKRLVALLVVILVVAGCGHPLVPTSVLKPTKTPPISVRSEWPILGEGGAPVLGVDVYALSNYPAGKVAADGKRVFAYIKNVLKANAVGIVWKFYAPSLYSDDVESTDATLSASKVEILTRIATRDHLLVEYRPLIVASGQQNNWEGLINPYPPAKWFSNYFHAELPYLRVAQKLDVREFVTSTEMNELNSSPFWPSFFTQVSRVYHGVISYAAWDGDYFGHPPDTTTFQTAAPELMPVRYLGMDMYWHMDLGTSATSAEVTAAWEALFGKMPVSVLEKTAIDETGIQARAGAYQNPPDFELRGRLSEQVQANWFTAACATVHRYHMRGVFFWAVYLTDDPAHPTTSLSTFEGREGAVAISKCARILR
jgi:hypothetical protein